MREFKAKDFPEYYQVNWSSAEYGTAIFLGRNVFLDPDNKLMVKEIDEFKEMARHHGVLLTMRREYKKTIQDDRATLTGFWFYCIGTTPAQPKKKKGHNRNCVHDLIKIFKTEPEALRIQAILKDYGLEHSEPTIRAALGYLNGVGYLESQKITAKQGHTGRPTIEYIRTDALIDYVIPVEFK